MTYKTRQEVLRAAADWMDVCEKAGVESRCKNGGDIAHISDLGFSLHPSLYEFPLALLEGNEVWIGSELYDSDGLKFLADGLPGADYAGCGCSWNPPKPKTVMVELPVNIAEYYSTLQNQDTSVMREACKKALENLK